MTIAPGDFRNYVIGPALSALNRAGIPPSQVAADLLMATAAVESNLGTWLMQVGGPASGVFQIEPATLAGVLERLVAAEAEALAELQTPQAPSAQIAGNLPFAAAIARLLYWQAPAPLPPHTAFGLWSYYKMWWNTRAGDTTEAQFMTALKLTDIRF